MRDGMQYRTMAHHQDDVNPDLPEGEEGGPEAQSEKDDPYGEEDEDEDDEDLDDEDEVDE